MKRIFLWIMCILGLQLSGELKAFNIKLLKGTHTICPNHHYAPFWGLAFLEERIAEQIYDFTNKQMLEELDRSNKVFSILTAKYKNLQEKKELLDKFSQLEFVKNFSKKKNSATEDLVSNLFYRANGVFKKTNAIDNPVRFFTPQIIGGILRVVWQYAENNKGKESNLNYFSDLAEALHTYLLSTNLQKVRISDPEGRSFLRKDYKRFVRSFVGAIQESMGLDAIYPENTAQGLLLGYLLAISSTHLDLQNYFRGLLADDTFVLPLLTFTNSELQAIFDGHVDVGNIDSFGNYLCAVVYKKHYSSTFPKMGTFRDVEYKKHIFPNCFETLLFNVVNIITFDSKNNQMGKVPEGFTFSAELAEFYKDPDNCSNLDVNNQFVVEKWLTVVENRAGCLYKRIFNPNVDRSEVVIIPDGYQAFIPVIDATFELPLKEIMINGTSYHFWEKVVAGKKYLLVPKSLELDCCELRSSFINFVVAISELLNGKHYTNLDEIFNESILKQDFENIALRLQWNCVFKFLESGDPRHTSIQCTMIGVKDSRFEVTIFDNNVGRVVIENVYLSDLIVKKLKIDNDNSVLAASIAFNLVNFQSLLSVTSGVSVGAFSRIFPVFNLDKRADLIVNLFEALKGNKNQFIKIEPYLFYLIVSMGFLDPVYTDFTNDKLKWNMHVSGIKELSSYFNNISIFTLLSDEIMQGFLFSSITMFLLNVPLDIAQTFNLILDQFSKEEVEQKFPFLCENWEALFEVYRKSEYSSVIVCLLNLYKKGFITKDVFVKNIEHHLFSLPKFIEQKRSIFDAEPILLDTVLRLMSEKQLFYALNNTLNAIFEKNVGKLVVCITDYCLKHGLTQEMASNVLFYLTSLRTEKYSDSSLARHTTFFEEIVSVGLLPVLVYSNIFVLLRLLINNNLIGLSVGSVVIQYIKESIPKVLLEGRSKGFICAEIVSLCESLMQKNLIELPDIASVRYILTNCQENISSYLQKSVLETCNELLRELLIREEQLSDDQGSGVIATSTNLPQKKERSGDQGSGVIATSTNLPQKKQRSDDQGSAVIPTHKDSPRKEQRSDDQGSAVIPTHKDSPRKEQRSDDQGRGMISAHKKSKYNFPFITVPGPVGA